MVSLLPTHGLEPYYRRELLEHWRNTTAERKRRGRAWYPAMRERLDSARGKRYTLAQASAVLSVTSPAIQLRTNLEHTERILRGESDSGGRFPNQNRPKIAAVLESPDAADEYVTGPKVAAFHRAILGDKRALVLDRWAIFAASPLGSDREENHKLRANVRAAIEQAYRRAARSARCSVRDFQATIWIHVRETTPILKRGKYVAVRFADIV